MDTRAKELFIGLGEVVTAHQILKYVKDGSEEERMRVIAGLGLGALGYIYGPQLQERIKHRDPVLSERISKNLTYAIGGAAAGALFGHYAGPKLAGSEITVTAERVKVPVEVQSAFQKAGAEATMGKPSGLVVGLSGIYLAYAMFRKDKDEEQHMKNLWLLGSGSLGYAFGPELIRKTKDIVVSPASVDDALQRYSNAGTALGIIGGSLLGYFKGESLAQWAKGNLKV